MGVAVDAAVPKAADIVGASVSSFDKSLAYMGLKSGESLNGKTIQNVFIGSCTNSRIEDLRLVADFVKGKTKADHVKAYIIPGSKQVEKQAREEGLGMNEDKIPAGEYCVSTSNRNFEGRQGPGARTILASPLTAAASAIAGKVTDIREWLN
jgi:3-isopropylmalate/(R)-2-methylmalate dehydratase large subunit